METNKVIIALKGIGGKGKTTTLNLLIDKLNEQYSGIFFHPNSRQKSASAKIRKLGESDNDLIKRVDRYFYCSINGIWVGINTEGDNQKEIEKNINILLEKGCSIIVTATRTKGDGKKAVENFSIKNKFKIEWVNKSICNEGNDAEQKKANESDAQKLFDMIHEYVKAFKQ